LNPPGFHALVNLGLGGGFNEFSWFASIPLRTKLYWLARVCQIEAMSRQRNTHAQDYIVRHFTAEQPALFSEVVAALKRDGKYGINVSPYEAALLSFLIRLKGLRQALEIGTLYGYSALWMAQALPADGRLLCLEKEPENFSLAKGFLSRASEAGALCQQIEVWEGSALELLPRVDFTPDLIFIDADKPNYFNYLKWAMENVAVGGLIIGDNTFLFGQLIGEDRGERSSPAAIESVSKFNETLGRESLSPNPRFRAIMIPTYEGITIAERVR
jgi:predicted O-methyltransferase YrrM